MAHVFPMKELALQAGVSLATVDRVLNQRPGVRPATQRRVRQAWAELERQQQQVGLRGRRLLVDLVMEAPLRFSRLAQEALDSAMRRMPPAVFRARLHLAETRPLEDWVSLLDAIARRGSQGVLLKGPDVPALTDAVARLRARGIPVITLVTDLAAQARQGYVGLDNTRAGQTAAYLMGQWLGTRRVGVLVSSSGPWFQGEAERVSAFRSALSAAHPRCTVHELSAGRGLHGPTVAATARLLERCPEVEAVYSVGGANVAILDAFARAGRRCRVFIGHDLDDDNRRLLGEGRLSAVLHHDLNHDMAEACRMLMHFHGLVPADPARARSNLEVVTPYNLPS